MMAQARQLFARVLDTPGGIKIATIHAFCQALLRRFPLEADVSPEFAVLDERGAAEALHRGRRERHRRRPRRGRPGRARRGARGGGRSCRRGALWRADGGTRRRARQAPPCGRGRPRGAARQALRGAGSAGRDHLGRPRCRLLRRGCRRRSRAARCGGGTRPRVGHRSRARRDPRRLVRGTRSSGTRCSRPMPRPI